MDSAGTPKRNATSQKSAIPWLIDNRDGLALAGIDAGLMFFVSLIALNGGSGSRIAAAIVPAAAVCVARWLCGNYTRSLAIYPRDEAYYGAAAVLLSAIPVLIVLSSVDDINPAIVLLTLALCVLATSVVHMRFHLLRRPPGAGTYAGLSKVSGRAWAQREDQVFIAAKRLFDVSLALAALVVFSPVMIAAALAIALEKQGPVFFTQERVGLGGRTFRIIKFRTMRADAGNEWARPGDSRITRIGAFLRRTSFDELPQIFNVLRGEMSIVGPRPEMQAFATQFAQTLPNYNQRHIVAPGITGWAQVYLKRNLQPDEMAGVLPYDLFYVEHSSVLLDAAIVFKTAFEVLFHRAV